MREPAPWLAQRLAAAPRSLRARMESAMAGAGGAAEDLGRRLRAVAESLLDEAKSGTPSREMAMTLLAADALITLACEWEAEHDVEPVGERR